MDEGINTQTLGLIEYGNFLKLVQDNGRLVNAVNIKYFIDEKVREKYKNCNVEIPESDQWTVCYAKGGSRATISVPLPLLVLGNKVTATVAMITDQRQFRCVEVFFWYP